MTYLLYDVAVVAILVFFFLRGRKKGLILTLCGLAAFFVALIGARVASEQLSPLAADAMLPHFSTVIEQQLGDDLNEKLDQLLTENESGGNAIIDALKALGFYDKVSHAIRDAVTGQAAQTAADVALALARTVAELVAGVLVFVIAFLIISALWFILSHALDLAARLPIIHGLNSLLGGVLGLAQGVLILFLAAWVLRLLGGVIPEQTVAQTTVLRFFINTNPFDLISGI